MLFHYTNQIDVYAFDKNVILVGFGTYSGTAIAAKEWGEKMEIMRVRTAVDGSWDRLSHELSKGSDRLLLFGDNTKGDVVKQLLFEETRDKRIKGQRTIGVVYNPEYERFGNYVPTILTKRYDAFLHIDETHALHPLHMPEVKEDEVLPETFPTGLIVW